MRNTFYVDHYFFLLIIDRKKNGIKIIIMAFFALHFLLTSRNGHGASRRVFNVLAYGAKGDGVVNNTLAFRAAAIATANAARLSSDRDRCTVSATMLVPPGRFLTGSFRLSSCVSLELAAGAVLLASNAIGDYPPDGWNWDPAFIDVYNASFVTITGDVCGTLAPLLRAGKHDLNLCQAKKRLLSYFSSLRID